MAEVGIDYPLRIKKYADRRVTLDEETGRPERPGVASELVVLTDATYREARRILKSFEATYATDEGGKKRDQLMGWSQVRVYRHLGTGFYFAQDRIAPGSVVVVHHYGPDTSGEEAYEGTGYFYISERKGKFSEPLVFSLTRNIDNLPVSHQVKCLNTNWNSPEKVKEMNEILFGCRGANPEERRVIEVWRAGKSLPAPKAEEQRKRLRAPRPGFRRPLPQPRPI